MKWTIPLLLAAAFAASLADAAAREWRSCEANIVILGHSRSLAIWTFEGRGSCRNKRHLEDCRKAARGAIEFCMRDSWRLRWQRRLSGGCASSTSGNRAFVKGILGAPFGRGPGAQGQQDFKWAIERAACCRLFRDRDRATVTVGVKSSGGKGCGGPNVIDFSVEGAYAIDCKRFRERNRC